MVAHTAAVTESRQKRTESQTAILEAVYEYEKLPDAAQRQQLAEKLGLTKRQIQVWFQNKRQRATRVAGNAEAASSREAAPVPMKAAISVMKMNPSVSSALQSLLAAACESVSFDMAEFWAAENEGVSHVNSWGRPGSVVPNVLELSVDPEHHVFVGNLFKSALDQRGMIWCHGPPSTDNERSVFSARLPFRSAVGVPVNDEHDCIQGLLVFYAQQPQGSAATGRYLRGVTQLASSTLQLLRDDTGAKNFQFFRDSAPESRRSSLQHLLCMMTLPAGQQPMSCDFICASSEVDSSPSLVRLTGHQGDSSEHRFSSFLCSTAAASRQVVWCTTASPDGLVRRRDLRLQTAIALPVLDAEGVTVGVLARAPLLVVLICILASILEMAVSSTEEKGKTSGDLCLEAMYSTMHNKVSSDYKQFFKHIQALAILQHNSK